MKYSLVRIVGCLIGALLAPVVHADGMVPETSVVIVNESDGEASIKVRNDDRQPALLLVTLENVPEDQEPLLFLTQPAWRVAPGKDQLVRFILRTDSQLTTQRLKRVIFEGVPQRNTTDSENARVGVTIRQNLPVIIHPKGLKPDRSPWTRLHWRAVEGSLEVKNPSAYVVRLAQELVLLPSQRSALLPRTYILPGETLKAQIEQPVTSSDSQVRLFPATVYGYAVDAFEAPVESSRQ